MKKFGSFQDKCISNKACECLSILNGAMIICSPVKVTGSGGLAAPDKTGTPIGIPVFASIINSLINYAPLTECVAASI
jgi:hypothetical protein